MIELMYDKLDLLFLNYMKIKLLFQKINKI